LLFVVPGRLVRRVRHWPRASRIRRGARGSSARGCPEYRPRVQL